MVQVIDTGGSLAGRLGKGFAKGLSEQVPKEVERARLSSGLKSLGEQGKSLTPFEQAAKLYGTAGVTPEMANTLLPLLQQQNAIREAQARKFEATQSAKQGTIPGTVSQAQQIGSQAQIPQQGSQLTPMQEQGALREIVTPESAAALQRAIVPLSQEQLRSRAAQLVEQFPAQFPTLEAGLAEAQSEDTRRLASEQAQLEQANRQSKVREALQSEFDKRLSQKTQKTGEETYGDILGDAQIRLRDRAEDEVARGILTPKQAAEKYANIALNFAKSRQNLKTMGGKSWFTKTPSGTRKSIESIRDEYKKIGELESFEKDLQTYHNLSPYYSSYLAFPPKDNKEINNSLVSLKPKNIKDIRERKDIKETDIADRIGKQIKPSDSLLSIALNLHEKGYDETAFLDQLRRDYQEGKISLNERQSRELQNREKVSRSIGDIFVFSLSGLDKLVEQ